MSILRGIISACCVISAPVLFLQGYANAEMLPGPPTWNGFWQASMSRAFIQAEQQENTLVLSVADGGTDFALDAWSKEPLATDALSVVATDLRSEGKTEELARFLALAEGIERRNRFIGALRMEMALNSGDLDETFGILDRFSRANPQFVSNFVGPLTSTLANDQSANVLRDALDAQPAWAGAFWNSVPADEMAVLRMYQLRLQTGIGTSPETDALLLKSLADAGQHNEAFDFWRRMDADNAQSLGFLSGVELPPIGWSVVSTGQRSLSPRQNGSFELYVDRQSFGELGRQLVRLSPGSYGFSARITPQSAAEDLSVALVCAGESEEALVTQSLGEKAEWQIEGGCETYWLILSGTAWESSSALRATISDMQFERQ